LTKIKKNDEKQITLVDLLIDGIVTDSKLARETPCTCYKFDVGELCYSKGIIGALDKEQIRKYCTYRTYKEGRILERMKLYKKAADKCKGRSFEEFWECVEKEIKRMEVIKILDN